MDEIILTHNNADFDAAAALLGAHKLFPAAAPVLPARINRNVADFIALYQNGLPFTSWDDLQGKLVRRVILVDTQKLPDVRDLAANTPVTMIDHHPRREAFAPHETFTGDEVGCTVTLLVEQLRAQGISLNSLEATLLMLGVHEDTGSLTYSATTPRDVLTAAWLLEQGAVLDTVRRFLAKPLNAEQQTLLEQLLRRTETRSIQGCNIIVAHAQITVYLDQMNSVVHRLRDLLESDGLVVVVEHPTGVQLIARSTTDAIPVGDIARAFGGGGHGRAAAASIEDRSAAEVVEQVWVEVARHIHAGARVADLMSWGVQTLEARQPLTDVIQHMRRIGHEGYPVVEQDRLVGLLTRRSADRALEHGLKDAVVRDVMESGAVQLTPDDSISSLERLMVSSGWGQIPVIDASGRLIGIVTRTDLIKHWVKVHPSPQSGAAERVITHDQLRKVLGDPAARLIETIAQLAQETHTSLYMVGGVVRDFLLSRPNLDIDFVVEGDAIQFAEDLRGALGGSVSGFRPFGTAKWRMDAQVAEKLGLEVSLLPDHVDFATSRNEFYEHPTALPTVYNGSIKLDLSRRDFTINTLAVQLSPPAARGRILDYYGGLKDLEQRTIRVLHSLSFVDDPTRMLRAVRFQKRLGFTIEPRTEELMQTAHPMLQRITGGRLRDELTLLLRETHPHEGLLELQQRGILTAIHPDFVLSERVMAYFQAARDTVGRWPLSVVDIADLHWHLALSDIPPERLLNVCDRLLFGRALTQSVLDAAGLIQQPATLTDPTASPSRITARLEDHSELALLTAWILAPVGTSVRQNIEAFLSTWRQLRPTIGGNDLQLLGLTPGPRYRVILDRLRAAWIDGEISSELEERQLLDQLVQGGHL